MSSAGMEKLPMELVLECLDHMDHVSISKLSATSKGINSALKTIGQQAAREYALLPTERAPRCPEKEEIYRHYCSFPSPSKSYIEMAIIENRLGSLRAFLNAGTDPNTIGTGGVRLLGTAIWNGRLEAMNILLEHNVDLSLELRERPPDKYQYDTDDSRYRLQPTPIAYAVAYGWHNNFSMEVDWDSVEPVFTEEFDMVSPLIRAGCQPRDWNDLQSLARRPDKVKLYECWFENGFKIDEDLGHCLTIMHWYELMAYEVRSLNDLPERVDFLNNLIKRYPELLTRSDATEECYDASKGTLLYRAIRRHAWVLVELLLEYGATVGVKLPFWGSEVDFLRKQTLLYRYTGSSRSNKRRRRRELELAWLRVAPLLEMRFQLTYYNF